MQYRRMAIELESPEQLGYERIAYNLCESSFTDQILSPNLLKNLPDLLLGYGDHLGNIALRQAIAQTYNMQADQVLITAGAANALFMVATALLHSGDGIVVVAPNYASNIETPRAIGCHVHLWRMQHDQAWRLDFDRLETFLKRDKIKLISLTTPHNPTGKVLRNSELKTIIALAEQYGCYVLVDETYRDLDFLGESTPLAATLSDRVISVSSLSKAYGMPGLRIGWLLCQNANLNELFLAAKEQIMLCNSVLDEAIALQVWQQRADFLPLTHAQLKMRYEVLRQWLQNEPHVSAHLPEGGAVCFAHINKEIDTTIFYRQLLEFYGTYVGRGAWFDMPDTYMRIGFGYPDIAQLQIGLSNISAHIELL
jgi:aspartate/methionine/tyrosine aminotransferase